MRRPLKIVADVRNVREITLLGSADADFWREHLRPAGLTPVLCDGRATVQMMACAAKFHGIPFREFSLSVEVESAHGEPQGAYLPAAWNSNRLFAWCERTMFATPYTYAAVSVDLRSSAAAAQVTAGKETIVSLTLPLHDAAGMPREAVSIAEERWEGPIWLPPPAGKRSAPRWFFGRLSGLTKTYAFSPGDGCEWTSATADHPLAGLLQRSQFVGREWKIREQASHAKSKTYVANQLA